MLQCKALFCYKSYLWNWLIIFLIIWTTPSDFIFVSHKARNQHLCNFDIPWMTMYINIFWLSFFAIVTSTAFIFCFPFESKNKCMYSVIKTFTEPFYSIDAKECFTFFLLRASKIFLRLNVLFSGIWGYTLHIILMPENQLKRSQCDINDFWSTNFEGDTTIHVNSITQYPSCSWRLLLVPVGNESRIRLRVGFGYILCPQSTNLNSSLYNFLLLGLRYILWPQSTGFLKSSLYNFYLVGVTIRENRRELPVR